MIGPCSKVFVTFLCHLFVLVSTTSYPFPRGRVIVYERGEVVKLVKKVSKVISIKGLGWDTFQEINTKINFSLKTELLN